MKLSENKTTNQTQPTKNKTHKNHEKPTTKSLDNKNPAPNPKSENKNTPPQKTRQHPRSIHRQPHTKKAPQPIPAHLL